MWGKGRVIFGKDIGKYQARKSGNIRPRNWDTSEKKTGNIKQSGYIRQTNQETSSEEIGKHQAKKSGNIRQRIEELQFVGKTGPGWSSGWEVVLGNPQARAHICCRLRNYLFLA